MKLTLPKPYLSYSQISMWEKNPEQYRQKYYLDGPSFENKETIFGKLFAGKMEKYVKSGFEDKSMFTEKELEIVEKIPRYGKGEHRIEKNILGVPFLGYLDGFDFEYCHVYELKTGKEPWNQVRVAKHDQLVVYSLLTRLQHGIVDPYVTLVWIETRNGEGKVEFDGHTLEGGNNTIEFTGKVLTFS